MIPICPLLLVTPQHSGKQDYTCLENDCSWFVEDEDMCAIKMLALKNKQAGEQS